jgi:D-arabinose 1-dehydrogenase-like Zn-dependent alcohol dehydrogenase
MTRPPVARAAIMTAPGSELQLRELPLMRPPLGGAVVKVLCCTICKSDLHTWLGRRAGPTPAILGHEAVGSIVELGEGLVCDAAGRTIAVGDRVTWTMHDCCGQCRYCAQYGLPMKCQALRKYGHQSCEEPPYLFGGFAEYSVITPGMRLLKLPDSLPELIAAPANCAVATVAAGWRAVSLQAGANVLIQGAGGLGCYAAALAAQAGCNRVIITDTSAERLLVAREFVGELGRAPRPSARVNPWVRRRLRDGGGWRSPGGGAGAALSPPRRPLC